LLLSLFLVDCWWTYLWVCLYMQLWSRDPNTSRLTINTSPPKQESKPDSVMTQPTSLQDRFYPIRTTLPSCIQLASVGEHNFELKVQFINTLPKFHGLEYGDAYFFIREFEKICLMIKISHLVDDAIRLRFVPSAPKDLTKKWLYSLVASSSHHGIVLSRSSWRNSIQFIRPLSLERTSCSSSKNLVNYFGGTLNASKTSLSNVLIME